MNTTHISEDVKFSKFSSPSGAAPFDGETIPDPKKYNAYSWIKAPRYRENPMETGPLARLLIALHSRENHQLAGDIDQFLKKLNIKPETAVPDIARAVQTLTSGHPPVLWIQGQSCSGCSVSLLNTENPGPAQLLLRYISLVSHQTLSTATCDVFLDTMNKTIKTIEKGNYYLVVEGSLPAGMPEACMMNHEPVTNIVARAAVKSKALITLGTCASFGGIPAAEGNPTGAVSVPDYLKANHIQKEFIRLPCCPAHPDWLVGTLVHLLGFGMPKLDDQQRPRMFYKQLVHDQCPRFADYERENFAEKPGDPGCLFKLGCCGPITYADCNIRQWNSGTSSCIQAGAPCTGCASEHYMADKEFSLFRKNEKFLK